MADASVALRLGSTTTAAPQLRMMSATRSSLNPRCVLESPISLKPDETSLRQTARALTLSSVCQEALT